MKRLELTIVPSGLIAGEVTVRLRGHEEDATLDLRAALKRAGFVAGDQVVLVLEDEGNEK